MTANRNASFRLILKHVTGLMGQSVDYKFEPATERGHGSTHRSRMTCTVTRSNLLLRSTATAATRNRAALEAARNFLVLLIAYYPAQILDSIVPHVSQQFPCIVRATNNTHFRTISQLENERSVDTIVDFCG